jgi:thiamine transporter ThiT
VLRFLGLVLVVWLVITVIGAVVKGLFWLAVAGLIFFVATAALGWNKRENKALPRGR